MRYSHQPTMPRLPRYAVPGQPQHVIQRGNNRTAVFADTADFLVYGEYLHNAMRCHACSVHAYVLMTNHVHLLVTQSAADGIGRLMQSIGRGYVRYFNTRHGRTGTLWEGRYRATLIDSESYLLACYRYIELNPLRAGLVKDAAEYRWSSHAANAFGAADPLVSPHPRYLDLARDPSERQRTYRALLSSTADPSTDAAIRRATHSAWALGSAEFRHDIEALFERRTAPLPRGRPWSRTRASTNNSTLTPITG